MKLPIVKVSALCFLSFLLTGCFSVKDETKIETTGYFTSEVELDFSALEKMGDKMVENLETQENSNVNVEVSQQDQFSCETIQKDLTKRKDEIEILSCEKTAAGVLKLKIKGQKSAENFSYKAGVFELDLDVPNQDSGSSAENNNVSANEFPAEMIEMMGISYDQVFEFPSTVLETNYGLKDGNTVRLNVSDMIKITGSADKKLVVKVVEAEANIDVEEEEGELAIEEEEGELAIEEEGGELAIEEEPENVELDLTVGLSSVEEIEEVTISEEFLIDDEDADEVFEKEVRDSELVVDELEEEEVNEIPTAFLEEIAEDVADDVDVLKDENIGVAEESQESFNKEVLEIFEEFAESDEGVDDAFSGKEKMSSVDLEVFEEEDFHSSASTGVQNIQIGSENLESESFVSLEWEPLSKDRDDIADQVLYTKKGDGTWDDGYSIGLDATEIELDVAMNTNYEVKVITIDTDGNEIEGKVTRFPTLLVKSGSGSVIGFILVVLISGLGFVGMRRFV